MLIISSLNHHQCKMAKKQENNLFIGISNGDELRRTLLECSKGILESLKDYENIKRVREEKIRFEGQLKNQIKSISKMINDLKTCLPNVKDIGIKREEVKNIKAVKVEKPQGKTEVENLEAELNAIEAKLNSMN